MPILALAFLVIGCLFPVYSQVAAPSEIETDVARSRRFAFQGKYNSLPVVTLNARANGVKFQTVNLKDSLTVVNGLHYYAFRFKTGPNFAPFIWSFKSMPKPFEWSILPEIGRMEGFTTYYDAHLPQDLEGAGKKGELFHIQSLGKNSIETNKGYLIWFRLGKEVEPKVTLSLNMIPNLKSYSFPDVMPMLYPK